MGDHVTCVGSVVEQLGSVNDVKEEPLDYDETIQHEQFNDEDRINHDELIETPIDLNTDCNDPSNSNEYSVLNTSDNVKIIEIKGETADEEHYLDNYSPSLAEHADTSQEYEETSSDVNNSKNSDSSGSPNIKSGQDLLVLRKGVQERFISTKLGTNSVLTKSQNCSLLKVSKEKNIDSSKFPTIQNSIDVIGVSEANPIKQINTVPKAESKSVKKPEASSSLVENLDETTEALNRKDEALKQNILKALRVLGEGSLLEICCQIVQSYASSNGKETFNKLLTDVQSVLDKDPTLFHCTSDVWASIKQITRYSLHWMTNSYENISTFLQEHNYCLPTKNLDNNISFENFLPYKCKRCNYSTSYSRALLEHDAICTKGTKKSANRQETLVGRPGVSRPDSSSETFLENGYQRIKVFCCIECDFEVYEKNALKSHVLSTHCSGKSVQKSLKQQKHKLLKSFSPGHELSNVTKDYNHSDSECKVNLFGNVAAGSANNQNNIESYRNDQSDKKKLKDKQFNCPKCFQKFYPYDVLVQHLESGLCCNEPINDKTGIQNKSKKINRLSKCPTCHKYLPDEDFKRHFSECHIICTDCGLSFAAEWKLNRHRNSRACRRNIQLQVKSKENKVLKCPDCKDFFIRDFNFERHRNSKKCKYKVVQNIEKESLKCLDCNEVFLDKWSFNEHRVTSKCQQETSNCDKHPDENCPIKKNDNSKSNNNRKKGENCLPLKSTQTSINSLVTRSQNMDRKNELIECSDCGFVTLTSSELATHVKIDHADGKYKLLFCCSSCGYSIKSDTNSQGKYRCSICDFIASNRAQLNIHTKNFHTKDGFKCTRCGFSKSSFPIERKPKVNKIEASDPAVVSSNENHLESQLSNLDEVTDQTLNQVKESNCKHSEALSADNYNDQEATCISSCNDLESFTLNSTYNNDTTSTSNTNDSEATTRAQSFTSNDNLFETHPFIDRRKRNTKRNIIDTDELNLKDVNDKRTENANNEGENILKRSPRKRNLFMTNNESQLKLRRSGRLIQQGKNTVTTNSSMHSSDTEDHTDNPDSVPVSPRSIENNISGDEPIKMNINNSDAYLQTVNENYIKGEIVLENKDPYKSLEQQLQLQDLPFKPKDIFLTEFEDSVVECNQDVKLIKSPVELTVSKNRRLQSSRIRRRSKKLFNVRRRKSNKICRRGFIKNGTSVDKQIISELKPNVHVNLECKGLSKIRAKFRLKKKKMISTTKKSNRFKLSGDSFKSKLNCSESKTKLESGKDNNSDSQLFHLNLENILSDSKLNTNDETTEQISNSTGKEKNSDFKTNIKSEESSMLLQQSSVSDFTDDCLVVNVESDKEIAKPLKTKNDDFELKSNTLDTFKNLFVSNEKIEDMKDIRKSIRIKSKFEKINKQNSEVSNDLPSKSNLNLSVVGKTCEKVSLTVKDKDNIYRKSSRIKLSEESNKDYPELTSLNVENQNGFFQKAESKNTKVISSNRNLRAKKRKIVCEQNSFNDYQHISDNLRNKTEHLSELETKTALNGCGVFTNAIHATKIIKSEKNEKQITDMTLSVDALSQEKTNATGIKLESISSENIENSSVNTAEGVKKSTRQKLRNDKNDKYLTQSSIASSNNNATIALTAQHNLFKMRRLCKNRNKALKINPKIKGKVKSKVESVKTEKNGRSKPITSIKTLSAKLAQKLHAIKTNKLKIYQRKKYVRSVVFFCVKCHLDFINKQDLSDHMKSHEVPDSQTESNGLNSSPEANESVSILEKRSAEKALVDEFQLCIDSFNQLNYIDEVSGISSKGNVKTEADNLDVSKSYEIVTKPLETKSVKEHSKSFKCNEISTENIVGSFSKVNSTEDTSINDENILIISTSKGNSDVFPIKKGITNLFSTLDTDCEKSSKDHHICETITNSDNAEIILTSQESEKVRDAIILKQDVMEDNQNSNSKVTTKSETGHFQGRHKILDTCDKTAEFGLNCARCSEKFSKTPELIHHIRTVHISNTSQKANNT